MSSIVVSDNNKFIEYRHEYENEFEAVVKSNSKVLFGATTIYVDLKPRINSATLGGSMPDALLFDLKNPDNPDFYLVEVELAKHDFYRHIFPQITKFIAFFRNPQARNQLIEKVFAAMQSDKGLEQEFKRFLKGGEIFKFMKDSADDSQNILLVIDDMKPELPEILSTYTEWSKMVRVLILKEYRYGEKKLLSLSPDFESVELGELPEGEHEEAEDSEQKYDEEYHLQGTDPKAREIYSFVKSKLLEFKPSLRFNPRKYYISIVHKRNVAFIYVRRKKGLVITVMLPESVIRNKVTHHRVTNEPESVQKFYGGECATVHIETAEHLDEIVEILKMTMGS